MELIQHFPVADLAAIVPRDELGELHSSKSTVDAEGVSEGDPGGCHQ
ncbi:hypothetical protein CSC43_7241 [Pseudomonas aeruginosa]|nr:hypothetical protein CSC43_7241 [Pseudomonas aeruginosa]